MLALSTETKVNLVEIFNRIFFKQVFEKHSALHICIDYSIAINIFWCSDFTLAFSQIFHCLHFGNGRASVMWRQFPPTENETADGHSGLVYDVPCWLNVTEQVIWVIMYFLFINLYLGWSIKVSPAFPTVFTFSQINGWLILDYDMN